ncbi:MAG: hypothetical protein ABIH09_03585 [Candidatus Omnitrophota bacterium]
MKKIKKHTIFFKITAILLIGLFLSSNVYPAVTLKIPNFFKATLAPEIHITKASLKEKIYAKRLILEEDAADYYIREQIKHEIALFNNNEEEWRQENVKDLDLADSAYKGLISNNVGLTKVVLVSITDLLKHLGQSAHVGLRGEHYGNIPVVYIDSCFFDDPLNVIQKHEIDEILQWEDLRCNILHLATRAEMREWIEKHVDSLGDDIYQLQGSFYEGCNSARDISKRIHDKSYPLGEIYEKIDLNTAVDFEYIYDLLTIYGYKLDEESNNVNIAAHVKPQTVSSDEVVQFLQNDLYNFFFGNM